MALENFDEAKLEEVKELDALKDQFKANLEGQIMTAKVMDKCLERFKVVKYEAKGEHSA